MDIFRHHTATDIIDLDDRTGRWTTVADDDDNPIMTGQMSMAQRADFSIRGSYAIENEKRCCFYWTDDGELIFRTPDDQRLALFKREGGGRLVDQMPDLLVNLQPATYSDGRAMLNMSTFSFTRGDGTRLFEITYDSERYLQSYLGNFTFAPDEDLSDWDFFVAVKRPMEELRVIARSFPEESQGNPKRVVTNDNVLTAETGDACPRSGLWVPSTRLDIRSRIEIGDPVPDIEGRPGLWVWVSPSV